MVRESMPTPGPGPENSEAQDKSPVESQDERLSLRFTELREGALREELPPLGEQVDLAEGTIMDLRKDITGLWEGEAPSAAQDVANRLYKIDCFADALRVLERLRMGDGLVSEIKKEDAERQKTGGTSLDRTADRAQSIVGHAEYLVSQKIRDCLRAGDEEEAKRLAHDLRILSSLEYDMWSLRDME